MKSYQEKENSGASRQNSARGFPVRWCTVWYWRYPHIQYWGIVTHVYNGIMYCKSEKSIELTQFPTGDVSGEHPQQEMVSPFLWCRTGGFIFIAQNSSTPASHHDHDSIVSLMALFKVQVVQSPRVQVAPLCGQWNELSHDTLDAASRHYFSKTPMSFPMAFTTFSISDLPSE